MTTTTTTAARGARGAGPVGGDWRERAACRGVDPDLFFPAAEDGPLYEAQVAAAKAVCAGCPVRAQCLTWALGALPYGVAGGLTEHERRQERARHPGPRRSCGVPQLPAGGTPAEVAAAGQAAIRAGVDPREVAGEFGVTERTALRWAAQTRPTTTAVTTTGTVGDASAGACAEGSRGGDRAPLLISQQRNPQAGTRAAEGHRS